MTQPEQYDAIVLTDTTPTVTSAPDRSLITLELLRCLHDAFFVGPDTINVGRTPDGMPCVYRVIGWDAYHRALIVEREKP